MYGKCNDDVEARKVFDTMVYRSVVSWTSMIAVYVQNALGEKALLLLRKFIVSMSPNHFTLGSVIIACASLGSIWKEVTSVLGFQRNVQVAHEEWRWILDIAKKKEHCYEIFKNRITRIQDNPRNRKLISRLNISVKFKLPNLISFKWEPPAPRILKLNTDGSLRHDGASSGYMKIKIAKDSRRAAQILNKIEDIPCTAEDEVQEIWELKQRLQEVLIVHVYREANRAAVF
ncbi:hypothetical protein IFM89_016493 [Coptis chinensis]|uniref:RNase H type-1 domain-containing protein n=1 Tax=Coptis chinensis TaxID=261450 RepID=A0A835HW00_9MAGN|nr:hypothetical protein IFM89_016493 [Coptis chinensis]